MKYIKQRHAYSCVVACIASMTGLPYKYVLRRMMESGEYRHGDGVDVGALHDFTQDETLSLYEYVRCVKLSSVKPGTICAIGYDNHCVIAEVRENTVKCLHDPAAGTRFGGECAYFEEVRLNDEDLDDFAIVLADSADADTVAA